MEVIADILGMRLTEALGWFLIHSLWQGALIGFLLMASLFFMKKRTAELRYIVSFLALITLLISSVITFKKAFDYTGIASDQTVLSPYFTLAANKLSETTATSQEVSHFSLTRAFVNSGIQRHFWWIVSLWLAGLLFYLSRTIGGFLRQLYMRKKGRIALGPEWLTRLKSLSGVLKIRKDIRIYGSTMIITPLTSGFFKPVILLPISFLSDIPVDQLEAILLHELAHIKRHDYLLNILQTLIETIFFYHPVVWLISDRIRKERENVCDDLAVMHTGDKISYAKALAMAQQSFVQAGQLALGFSNGRYPILERIKRLNTKLIMKTKLTEKLIAGVLVLSAFLLLSFIVDSNNHLSRREKDEPASLTDSAATKKVVIVKTEIDSTGKETTTSDVYVGTDDELDSLLQAKHIDCKTSEDVEKVIKIKISDDEDILAHKELLEDFQIELDLEKMHMEDLLLEKEIERELMEKEFLILDSLRDENIIIKKRIKNDEMPGSFVHVEVIADDDGTVKKYVIRQPEFDPEDLAEMEKAEIEIEISQKEMEKAYKEAQKAHREAQEAMKEAEKAQREAQKQYQYQYQYIYSPDDEYSEHIIIPAPPKMTLEEKQKALEAELKKLEKELKAVKKKLKEEKKQK